jgi:hypothetical protein
MVHKKLMQARIQFQGKELRKTGHNEFSGYYYFELCDFLPTVQTIFAELGLCGVCSFTADIATLTITDVDDGTSTVITSPMGSAKLKACHEVQNIGAVETYQRRYLWITAMEIVEHDALDGGAGVDGDESASKAPPPANKPAAEPAPPELLKDARKAAGAGSAAYEKFWAELPNPMRRLLLTEHDKLKKAAANAKVPA